MKDIFKNKSVVVTGSSGTIGAELVRQLLDEHSAKEVIGIDNNETGLFFQQQRHADSSNAQFFIASIRDKDRLLELFNGADIVFHSAAYKHVGLCEHSPFDAVQTNILGVKNVIEAAKEANVERVIFTSSDKAVNPTNVMGTTKLMGERLMTAANCAGKDHPTIYSSTRFGNVLGSRGSVIPIFREQIKKGGPVTLTDSNMTRFIMSIKEATKLVLDTSFLARGGEIFVTKMPVVRIEDLAIAMIRTLAPVYGHTAESFKISLIGSKPGEKLYEELMSEEEMPRTCELKKYFAVLPSYKALFRDVCHEYPDLISTTIEKPYHSANEQALSVDEIIEFLHSNDLFSESLPQEHPSKRL